MGKRGRKPSKERKGYFYEEQEEAVVKYINSNNEEEKNEIFNSVLFPALSKMVESIINRYKLYVPDEEFKETFDDTISFLMTKINYFNPDKGHKAYSYCGTICKNYLILKVKNYTKNLIRNEAYEDVQSDLMDNIRLSYRETDSKAQFLTDLINGVEDEIEKIINENKKLTDNEVKTGKALLQLLRNWEELTDQMSSNKFNKSSILLYLKEATLLNTKEIRDSMKKYKIAYYNVKKKLLD